VNTPHLIRFFYFQGFMSDEFDGEDGAFVFGGCMMFLATMVMFVNILISFVTKDDNCSENELAITHL
jgi:hypothetical protein